jgi:uncharacterized protein YyaL (SSP411 family)
MNRLASETSPYLLQHAENPVDWYPWGPEALERARAEDRPILLSVGYSACHWCHVMAHESFESEATARVMNELFVNVKVDREERPDVDAIYMQAVQAMTGRGGWPMTVFLTPDGAPFYAGTYFPPESRHGMPSFRTILQSVANAYRTKRGSVDQTADAMRELYANAGGAAQPTGTLSRATLDRAARAIAARYDPEHGGFDGAPKFPQAMALDFLLTHWARTNASWALDMVAGSFRAMARGGMYDQIGGGFHRYSVDAHWLVPHFEKMLYDNALLARLGVHLWQATGDAEIRRVTEETLDWVAAEMTAPDGGFYSALDADSEGHEGKFYVWDEAELDALLGDDAALVKRYWGVTPDGNFEGRNILHVHLGWPAPAAGAGAEPSPVDAAVARARPILYAARAQRVWPGRDDKILAGWNGIMLRALCEAARAFRREDYRALAVRTGEFLLREMVDKSAENSWRVLRSHKDGVTRIAGFLEDHGALGLAFLALYELTFERRWLDAARAVGAATVRWFWDDATGAFYDTASDAEALITRPREVTDNAVPSGTSLAVDLLLRLAEVGHDPELRRRADWVLETLAEPMTRYGVAFGHLLQACDMSVHGAVEVAIVGEMASPDFRALADEVGRHFVPALVVAGAADGDAEGIALLDGRSAQGGRATGYVCRQYACDRPATDPRTLGGQLAAAVRTAGAADTLS